MSSSSNPAEAFDDPGNKTEETKSCMVSARSLDITFSRDSRYWQWVRENETSEVAELLKVSWLEVRGKLETKGLSQKTLYEVVFVVKMKTEASGWDAPVNFKFTHPDGRDQWKRINLEREFKDSKDQWKDIKIGEFKVPETPGNIEFKLYKYGGKWKSGLVVKCVAVRPTTN